MSEIFFPASAQFSIDSDDPVSVRITVGDGQPGGSSLIWQDDIQNFPPRRWPFRLTDSGMAILGELLRCTTKVFDRSATSNSTSITITIKNGDKVQEYPFSAVVSDGDSCLYNINIAFV
ncbi:MAG: hypothetical protein ABJB74_08700 [Gemmatimonas sp.]